MKCTAYIIDDNIVSEFATRIVLEQSDIPCKILAFERAKEGLEAFVAALRTGEGVPAIILLDLKMPEMDGWDFLEELGGKEISLSKTAIYTVSNFTDSKVRERADTHELVTGYLERPLSKRDIKHIFSTVVGSNA